MSDKAMQSKFLSAHLCLWMLKMIDVHFHHSLTLRLNPTIRDRFPLFCPFRILYRWSFLYLPLFWLNVMCPFLSIVGSL